MICRPVRLAVSCMLGLLCAFAPARAQVVRNFTPRYSSNQPGDITLIGNTIMTCSGGGNCTNGRNGSGGSINNNDFTMAYVDVDADGTTFSSSSADLALPAGASVIWAGLYWGGLSATAARNTVKLQTPVAGYTTLTATQVDVSGAAYQCFLDVTARVQAGGVGTYTAANVYSTPNASNSHGGWSLVVVYGLASQPPRNLVVFDGYALVTGTTTVSFTVNGFVTPPAGLVNTKLGVVAYEGDLGYTGDSFQLNGTTLTNAANPTTNFFNSSISSLGANVTTKNPNYLNQLGFDVDLVSANGILPNSSTTATIALSTNGDTYYPGVVAFATDLYAPVFDAANFTKTVTDLNGGVVNPGDVLEYTVTMKNNGQDNAIGCVLRDTLPANVTYVAGSLQVATGPNSGAKTDAAGDDQAEYAAASRSVVARLGTGATAAAGGQIDVATTTSVKFRVKVQVPSPSGTLISNQAALAFTGAQSGVAFSAPSDGDPVTGGTQPTVVTVTAAKLRGTVFEDVNYGGGAGRTLAASGGVGVSGARVELYDATGAYLGFTRTDGTGAYTFDGYGAANYTVRVPGNGVRSTRPGAVAGLLPVLTYRTTATTGAATSVVDHVGGETPALADADSNTTSATLAALTTASVTAQAITAATLGASDLAGLDFGFNFDTIVGTGDSGCGTLRQFLLNANVLGNAGLAQSGLTAGIETAIFMVTDGLAHPGLRAGLASALTAGVARITLLGALPALTDGSTAIDGNRQTANIGNTNAAVLGGAFTAGVDAVAVLSIAAPEVEVRDGANLALGFDLAGAGESLKNIAVTGFGNAAGSAADACVRVSGSGATLNGCVLGATATAWADPGAALRAGGDLMRATGAASGSLQNCLLGWSAGSAVTLAGGANGWTISGCEIRNNAIGTPARGAISIEASGTAMVTGCYVTDTEGNGLDTKTSTGGNTFTNLTVRRSGLGVGATAATAGIRVGGSGNRVDRCLLSQNFGAGIQVLAAAANNTLTRNSCSANGTISNNSGGAASGQIGIDLQSAGDNADQGTSAFVTRNDLNDADTGGNALLNYPVLESAVLSNGSFTLTGWARPGSTIELFVSDGDPSGFGEGQSYVLTLTEGSGADLDATTSAYPATVNGIAQGTDNTNRFRFTVAAPGGVASGVCLTSTATVTGTGTSEFSGAVIVTSGVAVSGWAYSDANHNAMRDGAETGTAATLWAKLFASGGTIAKQVVSIDPATGAYTFTFVSSGAYDVHADTNNDPAIVTSTYPAGWLATESAAGVRAGVTVNSTDVPNQNFGLWHGSRVDGVVFRDDGAGGGSANDGAEQGGEAGLANSRVRLASAACGGGVCDSTLTDGAGAFTLWLPFTAAGASASVGESDPSGWLSTGGRAGTTGGAYARAGDAVTFTPASGVAYNGIAFGDVPRNTWLASATRTIAAGGTAFYSHRFTASSGGSVAFSSVLTPSPALPGWSLQLYRDLNCNGVIDAGEPVLAPATNIALAAGAGLCVVAAHVTPAGAPAGASERATLTASFTYIGAAPALAASDALDDVTTVTVSNGLVLTKSVDRASAKPGDYLVYTITFTNPGSAPLSNIVIRDATPGWTVFDSAVCASPGSGLTGCSLTQPALGATGAVVWTLAGTLAPGGSGSVSYRVKVQ